MTSPTPPPSPSNRPAAAPKAMDFAAVRDWPGYFKVMLGKPARETLVRALELFEKESAADSERTAIDLGCGEGRDTLELLNRGWSVTAVDAHPMAFELLTPRVPSNAAGRLRALVADFDSPEWVPASGQPVSLLNASYSLPFCDPARFGEVWRRMRGAIRPGGRFAGQLFGDRDSWAALPDRSHHPRGDLDRLFAGFVFDELREEERDDKDALGNPKHWHIFHIVARKL